MLVMFRDVMSHDPTQCPLWHPCKLVPLINLTDAVPPYTWFLAGAVRPLPPLRTLFSTSSLNPSPLFLLYFIKLGWFPRRSILTFKGASLKWKWSLKYHWPQYGITKLWCAVATPQTTFVGVIIIDSYLSGNP